MGVTVVAMSSSGESPSEIGSISLSLSGSAFCSGSVSPFRVYMEIRNSDWPETFAVIFFF